MRGIGRHTFCAVVLDIAEDLVAARAEGGDALMGDILIPVRRLAADEGGLGCGRVALEVDVFAVGGEGGDDDVLDGGDGGLDARRRLDQERDDEEERATDGHGANANVSWLLATDTASDEVTAIYPSASRPSFQPGARLRVQPSADDAQTGQAARRTPLLSRDHAPHEGGGVRPPNRGGSAALNPGTSDIPSNFRWPHRDIVLNRGASRYLGLASCRRVTGATGRTWSCAATSPATSAARTKASRYEYTCRLPSNAKRDGVVCISDSPEHLGHDAFHCTS